MPLEFAILCVAFCVVGYYYIKWGNIKKIEVIEEVEDDS